jgi:3-oxoacyl-[acyl-carrier protein] reductase
VASVLLDGKTAVIYGGGGGIGGGVARVFGREGATVVLAGRTREPLEAVAEDIRAAGGSAETAIVDALDARSVDEHADAVGRIDVSFNLISHGDVQGTPMAEMELEDYVRPVETAVRTNFLTMRAAARSMRQHGGGAILVFGGEGDPPRGFNLGSLQIGFHAVEAMRRQLAMELGPDGVRTVTLRTSGVPESISAEFSGRDDIARFTAEASPLGRAATLEDVGNAAVFAASDLGRSMTGATINVSCGTLLD